MSHFAKARSSWSNGNTPLQADILVLSGNIAAAINGVRGGVWCPLTQIVIGGSGLVLNGPLVVYGIKGVLESTSGARFTLGDGDWPEMSADHPMRNQRRVTSVLKGTPVPYYGARTRIESSGLQFNALSFRSFFVSGPIAPAIHVPIEILDNAQLTQATLSFAVMIPRTTVPVAPPKLRVIAIDASGNVTPLTSVAAGADADGYVSAAAPTSAAGWAGKMTLVMPLDVVHLTDLSTYTYVAEIIEETGTGSWPWTLWTVPGVDYVFTTNQAQTGTVGAASHRLLCVGQADHRENGIFLGAAGAWTRVTDLFPVPLSLSYTQGLTIPVNSSSITPSGVSYDGFGPSVYQLLTQTAVTPGTDAMDFASEATTPTNTPGTDFSPVGNLYTTVAIDMTIADFRYGQS